MDQLRENPFEVLRLDPSAAGEEIVRQAGRLRQRSVDEAGLNAIRQAVQILTRSSHQRALHALLAHPRPCYRWPALERFQQAFRRAPQRTGQESTSDADAVEIPDLDRGELADLLLEVLVDILELPPQQLEQLVASAARVFSKGSRGSGGPGTLMTGEGSDSSALEEEPHEEIVQQTAEALWQSLLYNPRG